MKAHEVRAGMTVRVLGIGQRRRIVMKVLAQRWDGGEELVRLVGTTQQGARKNVVERLVRPRGDVEVVEG